jgi:DNA-binding NarL/FixJ family response regulator
VTADRRSDGDGGWLLGDGDGDGDAAPRTLAAPAADVAALAVRLDELTAAIGRLERVVAALAAGREAGPSPSAAARRPSPLTTRQLEILALLAAGRTTDSIARELFLSRPTVRNHVARTLRAMGAHTRLEAVAMARDRGLL